MRPTILEIDIRYTDAMQGGHLAPVPQTRQSFAICAHETKTIS